MWHCLIDLLQCKSTDCVYLRSLAFDSIRFESFFFSDETVYETEVVSDEREAHFVDSCIKGISHRLFEHRPTGCIQTIHTCQAFFQ